MVLSKTHSFNSSYKKIPAERILQGEQQDLSLGITRNKSFTDNVIALNEAEIRVLKKAKVKRRAVKSRIEQAVTNTMNKFACKRSIQVW